MKHATDHALDKLGDLLIKIRKFDYLREKQRGIFYIKSIAFLHFHEGPTGLFGDIKFGNTFERFPVNTVSERKLFLAKIEKAIEIYSE